MGFWKEGERDLPGSGIGNPRLSFCSEFTWGKREEASFSLPLGIGEFALPVFCFLCFHFSFLFSEATVFSFFFGFCFLLSVFSGITGARRRFASSIIDMEMRKRESCEENEDANVTVCIFHFLNSVGTTI